MKNNLSHGTLTVCRFTLQQHYKAISVKILLLILVVMGLCSVPILRMTVGKDAENGVVSNVELPAASTIYLKNETEYPITPDAVASIYEDETVTVKETDAAVEALGEMLTDEPQSLAISICEDAENGGITVRTYLSDASEFSEDSAQLLADSTADAVYQALLLASEATEEQQNILRASVLADVMDLSDYASDEFEANDVAHAGVNLVYCYMVLIFSTLAMSYILALAIEEKQSKLVETILLSVTPSELLLGKFIAVTAFLFVGFALVGGSVGISLLIGSMQGDLSFITDLLESVGVAEIFNQIGAAEIVILVISVLLAYTIISFIAAIFGSCCSKTDDIQHASLSMVFVIMIGYMAGALIPLFESDIANIVSSLFPLTGIFCVPANYICGKISLPILILSLLLQVATLVFMIYIAGKTYQMLILYRGDYPKLKDLITMLRTQSTAKKEGKTE